MQKQKIEFELLVCIQRDAEENEEDEGGGQGKRGRQGSTKEEHEEESEEEPVDPVAGRVPGAVNLPTSANLDAAGRFLPADELARRYAAVGAVPGVEVAAYCGSGITACHDLLALEVAGLGGALYPGSWSGWVDDPSRPVERG